MFTLVTFLFTESLWISIKYFRVLYLFFLSKINIREALYEAMDEGLEEGFVTGTGKDSPIGLYKKLLLYLHHLKYKL